MFKFVTKYYLHLLIIWLLFAMAAGLTVSSGLMWILFVIWIIVLVLQVIVDKVVAKTEKLDQEIG